MATASVVRVRNGRDPAGVRGRVDRPAEHHRPERVRDVPEGLGQPARDRVDAGRADADDEVDEERVGPELEPLGDRSGDRPAAEPELLDQERTGRPEGERAVARRHPGDRPHRHAERDQVHHQGDVQAEPGDRRGPDDEDEERGAAEDPDRAIGQDPSAPEEGEQPDPEEQLAGQGQRGEQELLGGQVRDEGRERPLGSGGGRQAVGPAGEHDAEPADDHRPDDRVREPAPGGLRVAPETTPSALSMPQPTTTAASCEVSRTSAKRPLAAGPRSRARTMSVPKITIARRNRVTIVVSASRASGARPGSTGTELAEAVTRNRMPRAGRSQPWPGRPARPGTRPRSGRSPRPAGPPRDSRGAPRPCRPG